MKRLSTPLVLGLFLLTAFSISFGQEITRKVVEVPKVDSAAITIDGIMNESEWQNAGRADLVTSTSYEIWANYYGRETLAAPDYEELYARMLWKDDTLYVFVHMDEVVNDSTDLFWLGRTSGSPGGQWCGDQLFLSLSNRLGEEDLGDQYDGNVWSAPDGPYHFLILGDQVTLNDSLESFNEKQDTSLVYNASDIARWATFIDPAAGVWNVELAIHNPNIKAHAAIGFNLGGSAGSSQACDADGDAYAYYTWQPSVVDDPFAVPPMIADNDPGFHNLRSSEYWALLKFQPGPDDVIVRKVVNVPKVDSAAIQIDGIMNEDEWQDAGSANLVTSTSYEIWANYYGRETLAAPDYEELYARMLWKDDTLYVFVHMDEVVNDSTDLFWLSRATGSPGGQWCGDQLFLSLSNRLGEEDLGDQYDGNVWSAPDGPYHFLILGDQVTLNDSLESFNEKQDTSLVYNAGDIARWATFIDPAAGVWNVELAIHNPNIKYQAAIGFNLGGSAGSSQACDADGDAYAYYTWQPSVVDDPFAVPPMIADNDPGFHNLRSSEYWALLNFVPEGGTGVDFNDGREGVPVRFALHQNYPNPFNPSTTIRFEVVKSGQVTLKVYNNLGQLVTTLLNARQFTAGTYDVAWNSTGMASGVYFYQLESTGVVQTKRMVLAK